MIDAFYRCPDCLNEFSSKESAEGCCALRRENLLEMETLCGLGQEPQCSYCDEPLVIREGDVSWGEQPKWTYACECHYHPHYSDELYAMEDELDYELLQRVRGVEAFPWEYPDLQIP